MVASVSPFTVGTLELINVPHAFWNYLNELLKNLFASLCSCQHWLGFGTSTCNVKTIDFTKVHSGTGVAIVADILDRFKRISEGA